MTEDEVFRNLLKQQIERARQAGMSDEAISLALAGALVNVKSDAYR